MFLIDIMSDKLSVLSFWLFLVTSAAFNCEGNLLTIPFEYGIMLLWLCIIPTNNVNSLKSTFWNWDPWSVVIMAETPNCVIDWSNNVFTILTLLYSIRYAAGHQDYWSTTIKIASRWCEWSYQMNIQISKPYIWIT